MKTKENNKFLGDYGERVAISYLRSIGIKIIEHSFKLHRHYYSGKNSTYTPGQGPIAGEIDIVAEENGCLVFVEVKWRSSNRFGSPLEGVTPAKQRRLQALGEAYLALRKPPYTKVRFDVIGITGFAPHLKIDHIRNAF
ncbi:MAG: YraN family protein [Candidatus Bruticola sp.]